MPTGYTAILFDKPETTFRDFVLRCSRAFGACLMMRDDGLDVLPPEEVKPETYHLDRLREAEAKARELEVMPLAEAARRAKAERERNVASNAEYREKYERESGIVCAMRAQVAAWEPPTPEHQGLKDFMIQQLDVSKPYSYQAPADEITDAAWLARERKSAAEAVVYHADHWKREQASAADKTAWLRALWASVAPTGSKDHGG